MADSLALLRIGGDDGFGKRIVVHPIDAREGDGDRDEIEKKADDNGLALVEPELVAAPDENDFAGAESADGKGENGNEGGKEENENIFSVMVIDAERIHEAIDGDDLCDLYG